MKRLLLFILVIMGCCGRFASDAKRCPATPAVVLPVEPLLVRSAVDDVRCRQWVDSVLGTLSLKAFYLYNRPLSGQGQQGVAAQGCRGL